MVETIQNYSNGFNNNSPQGKSVLGKDDFMKLLISQLKNQDPLNPMEGAEFASQLAQFSSLEQLTNLNDSVKQSIEANFLLSQSINNTLATTLIGKDVKLDGDEISLKGQEEVRFSYQLPSAVSLSKLKIFDKSGAVVKEIKLSQSDISKGKLTWDTTNTNGIKLTSGDYTFKMETVDANGQSIENNVYKLGTIDGIRFSENGTTIIVNGSEYMLSDILEIVNPETKEEEV